MARRATPRPEYDQPTVLRPPNVIHHLWGDDESGFVGDEVLLSSGTLHALIFTLPVGGSFGHSEDNRTVFAADEVYLVLSGTIAMVNPKTGEVRRAVAGEYVFFRRDTWHHGINWGTEPVRVLEFFSPPPSTGSSSAYSKTVEYLEHSLYGEPDVIGNWPMDRDRIEAAATLHHIRSADLRYRAEGNLQVGIVCSTEHLTVIEATLLPGNRSGERRHDGDAFLHVLDGVVHVNTPDSESSNWHLVGAGESMVIPQGHVYRLMNQSAAPTRVTIGSAPSYLVG